MDTHRGRADDDLDLYPGSFVASNFLNYRFGVKWVSGVSGGLAVVKDRDEAFMRLRYTF